MSYEDIERGDLSYDIRDSEPVHDEDSSPDEVGTEYYKGMDKDTRIHRMRSDYMELHPDGEYISRSEWSEAVDDIDSWHFTTPAVAEEEVEPKPPAPHIPTVLSKLKGSVDIPEEFKFADSNTFYTMLRNIFRGKSILITGPSGCGKSSLGKI